MKIPAQSQFVMLDETAFQPYQIDSALELIWVLDTFEDDRVTLNQMAERLIEESVMADLTTPSSDETEAKEDKMPPPQLFFFPSGEVTPVEFTLREFDSPDNALRLKLSALGNLSDPDQEQQDGDER